MTRQRAQLSPNDALPYILGGRGIATLVGRTSRYTYKFSSPPEGGMVWVKFLTGPQNTEDYTYLGYIRPEATFLELKAGKAGNPKHPAFKAFKWYVEKTQTNPTQASKAEFWHEGTCCKCGRTLTVPESIARGIGPVCANKA